VTTMTPDETIIVLLRRDINDDPRQFSIHIRDDGRKSPPQNGFSHLDKVLQLPASSDPLSTEPMFSPQELAWCKPRFLAVPISTLECNISEWRHSVWKTRSSPFGYFLCTHTNTTCIYKNHWLDSWSSVGGQFVPQQKRRLRGTSHAV